MPGPAPDPAAPLLVAEGLAVAIATPRGTVQAVRGIDLAVAPGETLCLVGESGCCKSLTALALIGLLPPGAVRRAARLEFEGRDLLRLPDRAMAGLRGARLGMVFQDPNTALNPVRRIGVQLEEAWLRHRGGPRRAATERAADLLARVGIANPGARLGQYPHQLSGGLRQRVVLALALMCGPALLLADEPTTALDVTVQAQVLGLLRGLQRETGIGLLLITHDLGVVAAVGDRVAVMYAGEIVETGRVAEVFAAPAHPYTRMLLDAVLLPDPRRRLAEQPADAAFPDPLAPPPGCAFHPRCARAEADCRAAEPRQRPIGAARAACHHPLPSPVPALS
jgi:peptide/nickel transport system ATP-binding protein